MSLTTQVREELAHLPRAGACCLHAEASAALRLGGAFTRHSGDGEGFGLVLEARDGAVVRRVHAGIRACGEVRPELSVLEAGGLRRSTTYRLELRALDRAVLADLGVVDARGAPRDDLPALLVTRTCDRTAYLRGALLVAGSVSEPGRDAHLELRAASASLADALVALLHRVGAPGAHRTAHRHGWRAVLKSGQEIADVLAATGAHGAFLAFDQGRLRRELRGAANRAANADRANLARAVAASARQAAAIERVVAAVGWENLDEELRDVALARLANPEAALGELGALLDPPVGKSAVHRRIQRLLALADADEVR